MAACLSWKIDVRRLLRITLILVAYLVVAFWWYVKTYEMKVFKPTTAAERQMALGSLENASRVERQAYEIPGVFSPVGTPKPLDWLSRFPERGQTYDEYRSSGCLRPDATRRVIYFQPVSLSTETRVINVDETKDFCQRFFCMDVVVRDPIMLKTEHIRCRMLGNVPQWNAEDILEELKKRVPTDAFCVLALTGQDLYPDNTFNFVFGLASVVDRVGIYSVTRMDPRFYGGNDDKALTLLRSCKLIAHETGHMFGCYHCVYFGCLMNGSNGLQETDRSPIHLCPICLRKLQFNIGFDLQKRYAQLSDWFKVHGFNEEYRWVESMLERIASQSSAGVKPTAN